MDAPNPQATSARVARMRMLYDNIMTEVCDGLKEDALLEGIDESVIDEFKRVSMHQPASLAAMQHAQRARSRTHILIHLAALERKVGEVQGADATSGVQRDCSQHWRGPGGCRTAIPAHGGDRG
jgi:hypothetical protein